MIFLNEVAFLASETVSSIADAIESRSIDDRSKVALCREVLRFCATALSCEQAAEVGDALMERLAAE